MNEQTSTDTIHARQALGSVVSQARYTPYGELRWPAVSQMPTDFGYTGQRADSFGLMDYNARFYSPHLGRFVSADTVVPNPGKAVDFDRFAYSANNPIRYRDPSGHRYCEYEYGDSGDCVPYSRVNEENLALYNAFLNEDWELFDKLLGIQLETYGDATWDTATYNGITFNEADAVRRAAMDVAFALGRASGKSAADAFRQSYNTSAEERLVFRKVDEFIYNGNTYDEGGVTRNSHLIVLADLSNWRFDTARNNVVHELGHAFNAANGSEPMAMPDRYVIDRNLILVDSDTWQLNRENSPSETFADFFVAFTYNVWGTGDINLVREARNWMTTNVAGFVH